MCRIPKVLILAPADRHMDLRRTLSSLEYDITAAVTSVDEAAGITADVAVAWAPDEEMLLRLRELSLKVVAIGGDGETADMKLGPEEAATFKTRLWELFEPT